MFKKAQKKAEIPDLLALPLQAIKNQTILHRMPISSNLISSTTQKLKQVK